MALKTCKECKQEISSTARRCPQCGAYQWTRGRIGCLGAVGLFCIIPIIFVAARSCRNDTPTDKSIQTSSAKSAVVPAKQENAKAANSKQFEICRQKLKKAQKLDVLYNMEYKSRGLPKVTVGPTFFKMPIDGKEGFCDTVNCFFVAGDKDKFISFDLLDWRNGKRVGRYSYGKLKME